MAKHVTRWSPDTCSCVIEYEWDDLDPPETRQHTLFNYINRCPAHSSLTTDDDRYTGVKDENTRKNITLGLALENGPASLYDEFTDIDDLGNTVTTRHLKNNITYNWFWSGIAPDRTLNISLIGITLTNQQKNAIRNVLNNRFGIGKVVVA